MTPPAGGLESVRLARRALVVLTLINLFNYLDRWIVAALNESIKHSELRPSDAQLGFLMSGFIVVYMLAAPLFGMLGDTRSRTRLIGLGVGIWSVATALAGFARSYGSLFAARAEEHTSELQSPCNLVCRLLLEKKKNKRRKKPHPHKERD